MTEIGRTVDNHADSRARNPRQTLRAATMCCGGGMGTGTIIERLS